MNGRNLRPSEQRAKQLKRISDYFMSDVVDTPVTDASNETVISIRTDKKSKGGKAGYEAKTDKNKRSGKKGKKVKSEKNGKSGKRGNKHKAGKDKKSSQSDTREKGGKDKKSRKRKKKDKSGKLKKSRVREQKATAATDESAQRPGTEKQKLKSEAGEAKALAPVQTALPAIRSEPATPKPPRPAVDEKDTSSRLHPTTVVEATDKQAEKKTGQQTTASPAVNNPRIPPTASKRRIPVRRILAVGLFALLGLWGYQNWFTESDSEKTLAERTGKAQTAPHKSQTGVAPLRTQADTRPPLPVPGQMATETQGIGPAVKIDQPPVTRPQVKPVYRPESVSAGKRTPETTAVTPQRAYQPAIPQAQYRFRQPGYGQYQPYPGRQPGYYGNYPQQRFYGQPQPR